MAFRLTKTDKRVIRAFIDGRPATGRHLISDGRRLDIMGMGGRGVAQRSRTGNICIRELGSRTGQIVGRAVKRETPSHWFKGWCRRYR